MNIKELEIYCAPGTGQKLELNRGRLETADGRVFELEHGVPKLLWPPVLAEIEERTKGEYDRVAEQIYDAALEWQFAALYEDEDKVRESMIDQMCLQPADTVLEVGCGTGRDSFRLARRLGRDGALYLQDLSPGMVHTCIKNLDDHARRNPIQCPIHYSISNATYLPFPDNTFDAVFHFGGFNEFSDGEATCREFARVVKPGGRVLFGDESVGPWLRHKEFGKIVTTNNPLFAHELPLAALPECARDVSVRWIMANCFYVVSFVKGDGPPSLNLDLKHKGRRGGSMRSRYFGVMEGVSPEAKDMARRAASKAGLSLHDWLDSLVRKQAAADLGDGAAE